MTNNPAIGARIAMRADNLNEANRRFAQTPLTQPVFLNSVPKSGSHLLRNIVRMFVPVEQQYDAQFIQFANLQKHVAAFDPERNLLSWGHLFFSDASAIETAPCRKILLVRDPYDWVLARARFFLSEEFQGNVEHLRNGSLSPEALLNVMIFGIRNKASALFDVFFYNAAAWLGTGVYLVRYEDLIGHLKQLGTDEAEAYFAGLFEACGIAMPADWRERVEIGSDRSQSGTARENLSSAGITLPDELPEMQKRLVELALPGLRPLLGYA
jgi:hypothetical protein